MDHTKIKQFADETKSMFPICNHANRMMNDYWAKKHVNGMIKYLPSNEASEPGAMPEEYYREFWIEVLKELENE
jgi:hypothetical protein